MKTMRTLSFATILAVATAGAGFAATNSTDTTMTTGPGNMQTTTTPPNSTAVAPHNTVVGQGAYATPMAQPHAPMGSSGGSSGGTNGGTGATGGGGTGGGGTSGSSR